LLHGGVRLYEYQPAMLHTKAAVFDDELVLLGSANMDNRSFRLNFEASCFVGGRGINEAVAELFLEKLRDSREVVTDEVLRRAWTTQLVDSAAHLLSPFL
ncbi:MAG: phospholipase D-like domain-containing protein, partial [Polyangiaceae bacterium]|nr:phospholipase D-like domain-containing protein [Polyangiaceae bacterium]